MPLPSQRALRQSLTLVAPGTPLREGLDRIILAKMGALLIVGDSPDVLGICTGGFLLDAEFSPQRLSELAKMDGAIILSTDGTRIARANVHLLPDAGVPTNETGTRHRTAERVARSVDVPVISVSEEMSIIAVYRGEMKHQIEPLAELLGRASQVLHTMERFRSRFDSVLEDLSLHEIEEHVTVRDVATALQRGEMVRRLEDEMSELVIELGTQGRFAQLQRDEFYAGLDREMSLLRRDYPPRFPRSPHALEDLSTEELGDLVSVARAAGLIKHGSAHPNETSNPLNQPVVPHGYRLLAKVPRLNDQTIDHVAEHFDGIASLLQASVSKLVEVDGVGDVRARTIREGLVRAVEAMQAGRFNR